MVAPPESVRTSNASTVGAMEKKDECQAADEQQIQKCLSSCCCSASAYGNVCPCTAMLAGQAAAKAITKLKDQSSLFNKEDCESSLRKLTRDDLEVEEKLGEGGFCIVKACTVKQKSDGEKEEIVEDTTQIQPLAIKYLKRPIMVNRKQFQHGAADLAQEAYFLHALQGHPNIIQLHSVKQGNLEQNIASGQDCGFFIVVDRLYSTLEQKLELWRKKDEQQAQKAGLFGFMNAEYRHAKKQQFQQRLQIAISIATAMQYLHSQRVVFRDLKPDNIGFDKDGVLKLFDFGLAKELKAHESHADGRYHLTGNTGSRRYMAPEVAKELPYNQSVDVYSFGILLQELLSGEKPFFGYSSGKHMSLVVMGGERPHVDKNWPMNLQWLLKRCWSPFPTSRPDFDVILQTLKEVLEHSQQHSSNHTSSHASPPGSPTQQQEQSSTASPSKTRTITTSPSKTTHKSSLLEPPVGGFAALLRPKRTKNNKSHGSQDSSSGSGAFSPPALPPPQPAKRHGSHDISHLASPPMVTSPITTRTKRGISIGGFFSRK